MTTTYARSSASAIRPRNEQKENKIHQDIWTVLRPKARYWVITFIWKSFVAFTWYKESIEEMKEVEVLERDRTGMDTQIWAVNSEDLSDTHAISWPSEVPCW